jgi:hypothetical protein
MRGGILGKYGRFWRWFKVGEFGKEEELESDKI